MAAKEPAQIFNYRDVPELKDNLLEDNIVITGKHLGTGSFGSVVEVTVGGTLYAGKKIHVALLDPQDKGMQKMVDRFVSECKLMSKVRHPNIVQLMGLCFSEDSPHPMLVMERLDTNLDNVLEKKKNLSFPLVLHFSLDVTKGLVYLHSLKPQPIIHRDLTARNILLYSASMQAKIADLGNAMMIDEMRLSRTLSQAPGTTPYMPPEALQPEAKYNTMLDVFSFGHLALFAVLEEFPCVLLAMTYSDPLTDELKARSEVERRETYIRKLFAKLTKEHPITQLILQCLHNVPAKRELDDTENSPDLIGQTEVNVNTQEEQMLAVVQEDPETSQSSEHEQVEDDSVAGPGVTNQPEDNCYSSSTSIATNIPVKRIEALKSGAPVVLQIYKSTGVIKKSSWHHYVFKIKNGTLQYSRSGKMDKPLNELKLSSVVHVKACPPEVGRHLFCFEIHFSGKKGSPWTLGTFTQEERLSWMEAIKKSSSESNSESQNPVYTRPLPPVPIDNSVQIGGEASHLSIDNSVATQVNEAYDDIGGLSNYSPHATAAIDVHTPTDPTMQNQTHNTESKDATAVKPDLEYKHMDHNRSSEEAHLYEPISLATKDEGNVYMRLFPASKVTAQQTTSSKSNPALPTDPLDLTIEHFADADPRQAQLWMLLQIQKMVQKMEDMYESAGYLRPPSPLLQTMTATDQPPQPADSLQPPSPIPGPNMTPTEQPPQPADTLRPPTPIPGPTLTKMGQPRAPQPADSLRPPSPIPEPTVTPMEQPPQPADSLPPPSPLPPISTVTEHPPPTTEPDLDTSCIIQPTTAENQQPPPSNESNRVQQNLPARNEIYMNVVGIQTKSSNKPRPVPCAHSPRPPAIPPRTYKKVTYVQVKESCPPAVGSEPKWQHTSVEIVPGVYKKVPQQEMIDTLVAQSKTLTSEIVEHLVIEDDEEYIAGSRPDWTKANTHTIQQESSLEEMQKQALYISQDVLRGLQEIGEGQFGKVYKSLYKKPADAGAGIQVAIKIIKKYDSKTETEAFLKK